jgi:hypothetical protein
VRRGRKATGLREIAGLPGKRRRGFLFSGTGEKRFEDKAARVAKLISTFLMPGELVSCNALSGNPRVSLAARVGMKHGRNSQSVRYEKKVNLRRKGGGIHDYKDVIWPGYIVVIF